MFLKKVYRYNKWLFAGMVLFIVLQLACFYKGGMVFSPFYNYGMYSAVIKPQETYQLYTVHADSNILSGKQFTPQQWDALHFTLMQLDAAACNQHFYEKEIARLFTKFHLPVPSPQHFVNSISYDSIREKYPLHLAAQFSKKHVSVQAIAYQWNGEVLIPAAKLSTISSEHFQCK